MQMESSAVAVIKVRRTGASARQFVPAAALLSLLASRAFCADESQDRSFAEERFAFHGQFTYVEQGTDSFRAPYAGPNSLSPNQARETTDLTLYAGAKLWSGAEIW